jgi:ABC-2 type transport system ATP-binding protein
MIETEGLSRRYGELVAVSDVSFNIGSGEVVGLLGHNGAGKSTIMKMLTGSLEPSAGRIAIGGRDMAHERRAIQRDIGYLPENCPVYPDMTVADYLDYQAVLHGVSDGERARSVRRAVERTALHEKALDPVATLSRGYRQRVGVAAAILHQPEVIILDEPTNGLDPSQIHEMRALVRSLAEGAAVLVSTHILQEVQAVCDRVLVLREGRLALDSRLDELGGAYRLLLTTDADPAPAQETFGAVPGVVRVEPLGGASGRQRYAVVAADDASSLAPEVARRAHQAGYALYALEPESRDLEAVYAEVNATA